MNMRASPRRCFKTLFLMSMMGIVLINLNLFLDNRQSGDSRDKDPPDPAASPDKAGGVVGGVRQRWEDKPPAKVAVGGEDGAGGGEGDTNNQAVPNDKNNDDNNKNSSKDSPEKVESAKVYHIGRRKNISADSVLWLPKEVRTSDYEPNISIDTSKFLSQHYTPIGNNPEAMKAYIAHANRKQHIRNLDRFDLPTSENSAVIVVQVHNRTEYLQILLDSFRKSRYIENALLVFSHDYFSDEVNQLISEIDFCLVMQIYYPIPIQLYQHEFPGEDPGDCPRDSNREQAAKLGCNNSLWPDKYGHYREAKYTQTKHHWFWKANTVFERLKVMKNFNGPVLFVEEDHMMTEDFIHVLQKMYRYKDTACKDCSILTLGTYMKQPVYGSYSKKGFWERLFGTADEDEPRYDGVDIMNWISSKHNMGMAFNRQVWERMKSCAEAFCRFDDYNWDWSLQFVSMSCLPSKLRVMCMKSPRIYHIGECGVHHKGKNCDPAGRVHAIKKLLEDNRQHLFPDQLEIAGYPRSPTKMPKPNGGWGDRRDHELCLRFTKPDLHS